MADVKAVGFQKAAEALLCYTGAEALQNKDKDDKLKPSNCNNIWTAEHTKDTKVSAKPCETLNANPANIVLDAGNTKTAAEIGTAYIVEINDKVAKNYAEIKNTQKEAGFNKMDEALVYFAAAYGLANGNSVEKAKKEDCDTLLSNPADFLVPAGF